MVFPAVMYGCESWITKKGWVPKNWCFCTMVLDKTLESPLDSKEKYPVNPKGNQSWLFIGRTNAEDESPILWPPDVKSQLIGKDPDAGKDWRQEEKGVTEDEIVGWHPWHNGHEFEQAPGDGERTWKLGMLQSIGSQRNGHDWATGKQEQHLVGKHQRNSPWSQEWVNHYTITIIV